MSMQPSGGMTICLTPLVVFPCSVVREPMTAVGIIGNDAEALVLGAKRTFGEAAE